MQPIEPDRTYTDAKQHLIDGLQRAADAHEAGDVGLIATGFDEIDARLPRDADVRYTPLFIALAFWDGWIDAHNHAWQYYDGIEESDWPRLARHIVTALQADSAISHPLVLLHFGVRPPSRPKH